MMKRIGAILTVVIIAVAFMALPALAGGLNKPSSKVREAQKLIDQAWNLDKVSASVTTYKQCLALMKQADKLDPNNYSILIDLSRFNWLYGDNLPKETSEQQKMLVKLYAAGMAAAGKSIKVKETVDAHYWFAVNKASSLEFSSIVSQAAGFPTIFKHSNYVTDNGPDYYYGAAGRLWSEIITRVPKQVVKMVGVDVQMVTDLIDDAIKIEPRYLDNYVYKARFIFTYYGKKDEALKLLEHVIKQKPEIFPEEVTANKVAIKDARELWKTITGKDYPAR